VGVLAVYLTLPDQEITQLGNWLFDPEPSASDTVSLKVISHGGDLFFFANGAYRGRTTHSGSVDGGVGIATLNVNDTSTATVHFTNLVIRALN
jgi:hypothetical protein